MQYGEMKLKKSEIVSAEGLPLAWKYVRSGTAARKSACYRQRSGRENYRRTRQLAAAAAAAERRPARRLCIWRKWWRKLAHDCSSSMQQPARKELAAKAARRKRTKSLLCRKWPWKCQLMAAWNSIESEEKRQLLCLNVCNDLIK